MREAATQRLRRWAARKHGEDTLPLRIAVRRIYILPTTRGLVLAALIVAMLLAGLNYNSNLALAFGFLMMSIALVAMHHCHRNLLGLSVDVAATADGFAGGTAVLELLLENSGRAARHDIEIRCAPGAEAIVTVPEHGSLRALVSLPTARRGILELRQTELRTTYPLGWFRAWTYVQAPQRVFVAPAPRGTATPPATAERGEAAGNARRGDENFSGLGAYSPGVPLKHMAWKVLARGGAPAVRQYADTAAAPQWLDFNALAGLDTEARLAQLCRWVLEHAAAQRPFALRLPDVEIPPGLGTAQRSACLRALAACKPGPA